MDEQVPIQEPTTPKVSPALRIISAALTQVEEVVVKADQSLNILQENLQQVTRQKIALDAQAKMLNELKIRISQEEAKS